MTTDEKALRLAVAANPDEDDPRLRLRDLWDEAGDPRGEFARVQEEIARHPRDSETCLCGYWPRDGYHHNSPSCPYVRDDALLAAHETEWHGIRCPAKNHSDSYECPTCGNTKFARVTWDRGHVVAVRCELGEVVGQVFERRPDDSSKTYPVWRPTPWALAVCRWHPVVRFEVTDREPEQMHGGWAWWDDGIGTGPASIPRVLLAEPSWNSGLAHVHGQRETALNLLYTRIAAFVRASSAAPVPIKNV